MKNLLIGVLAFLLAATTLLPAEELETYRSVWNQIRAPAVEDSSTIDLTNSEGDFANKPAAAIEVKESKANKIMLAFCGGAAANKTFSYKVFVWARNNGMAEVVCDGTGTTGAQDVVLYPHDGSAATNQFWADTLTVTGYWVKPVYKADADGNDRCSKICFDLAGISWIYVEITDADGVTGNEAATVGVFYRYF
jgi:hypothetical protein